MVFKPFIILPALSHGRASARPVANKRKININRVLLLVWMTLFPCLDAFAGDLTVAVAANVQYTFEELKIEFEKETGIKINPVIGSSGKLTTQIENGAPFDVFLSADMSYPQRLEKEGLANSPRIYAYGTLVLWTFKKIDLSQGLSAVGDPSVKKIAIASPTTAPYGRQAIHALKHDNLYGQVHEKLIYGESIAQTNQYITSQAADLGLTAKSVVMAPHTKDQGTWIEIDPAAYEPIAQGVVILKRARQGNSQEAQRFFDFLFSTSAQDIFKKYGYLIP